MPKKRELACFQGQKLARNSGSDLNVVLNIVNVSARITFQPQALHQQIFMKENDPIPETRLGSDPLTLSCRGGVTPAEGMNHLSLKAQVSA